MTAKADKRARTLLVVGAVFGIVLAIVNMTERAGSDEALGEGIAALVDGSPILRVDYDRALAAVAADRRGVQLDADERRRVLERLIDEELLVQRGIELGLPARDRQLRNQLSAAVIGLFTARGMDDRVEPTDEQLRQFFVVNEDWFREPASVDIDHLFFAVPSTGSDEEVRLHTLEVRTRLASGETLAQLAAESDRYEVPIPDGDLHLRQIRDLLGPTVGRAVTSLGIGDISAPLRSGRGYHLVRVVDRTAGLLPDFASIRDVVATEYERRDDELQLRMFLDERRREASIRIAEDLR